MSLRMFVVVILDSVVTINSIAICRDRCSAKSGIRKRLVFLFISSSSFFHRRTINAISSIDKSRAPRYIPALTVLPFTIMILLPRGPKVGWQGPGWWYNSSDKIGHGPFRRGSVPHNSSRQKSVHFVPGCSHSVFGGPVRRGLGSLCCGHEYHLWPPRDGQR